MSHRIPGRSAVFDQPLQDSAGRGAARPGAPMPREAAPGAAALTQAAQSGLAYRLAAAVMLANVMLGLSAAIAAGFGATSPVFVIDAALAIGLIDMRRGARPLTLARVVVGVSAGLAYAALLLLRGYQSPAAAAGGALPQLAYAAALILILTGHVKPWRLALAIGIYVIGLAIARLWAASMGPAPAQAADAIQGVIEGLLALAIAEMAAAAVIKQWPRGNWFLGWAIILLTTASLITLGWVAWFSDTGTFLEILVMAAAWLTAAAVVLMPRPAQG